MIPRIIAPLGYLRDELKRQRLIIAKLNSTLARLIPRQLLLEMFDRFVAWVQPNVLLSSGKVDYVVSLPISRHAPRNPFFRSRKRCPDRMPHLFQKGLDFFRLGCTILGNRFWQLTARMALIDLREHPSTFWTAPHIALPRFRLLTMVKLYHKTVWLTISSLAEISAVMWLSQRSSAALEDTGAFPFLS
jgi:hypothetical protein